MLENSNQSEGFCNMKRSIFTNLYNIWAAALKGMLSDCEPIRVFRSLRRLALSLEQLLLMIKELFSLRHAQLKSLLVGMEFSVSSGMTPLPRPWVSQRSFKPSKFLPNLTEMLAGKSLGSNDHSINICLRTKIIDLYRASSALLPVRSQQFWQWFPSANWSLFHVIFS